MQSSPLCHEAGNPYPQGSGNHEHEDAEGERGGSCAHILLVTAADDDTRESGRQGTGKHLLDRLADVKFKVEGKVKEPLAAPELADALYEYFETHDDISVREFARISHYAPSTAYKKLGEYVAYGEMERVPRISGCFRPTPGHFGREE